MKLSDYEGNFFRVINDGCFYTLGYPHDKPNMPYISFAESKKYLNYCCKNEDISCVICKDELADDEILRQSGKGIAVCKYPRMAFYRMHNFLADYSEEYNPKFNANVIGADCNIHPTAVIADKGVIIKNNVTIEPYVVIHEGVTIGNNSIIRSGAIIGGINQLVSYDEEGRPFHIRQIGRTYIGNSVEISYHAVIVKGIFTHEVTYLDDNVCAEMGTLIAHNVKIGCNSLIGVNSLICGNTKLGERIKVAPGAILSNRLIVGDDVNVTIGAVVADNVTAGSKVTGNFAIEHSQYLKWHMKKLRE